MKRYGMGKPVPISAFAHSWTNANSNVLPPAAYEEEESIGRLIYEICYKGR